MSVRSHFFLMALVSALLYYHLTFGYPLGFVCTWSAILMVTNHLLDIVVDSPRLQWIKKSAFVVFGFGFLLRVVFVASMSPTVQTWQSLGTSLILMLPICVVVWIPIGRSMVEPEIDRLDSL